MDSSNQFRSSWTHRDEDNLSTQQGQLAGSQSAALGSGPHMVARQIGHRLAAIRADAGASGELITLANGKNIASNALFDVGVFKDLRGKTALTPREELLNDWTPEADKLVTVWECVQNTARVLNAEDGGGEAAGRLVAEMGPKA